MANIQNNEYGWVVCAALGMGIIAYTGNNAAGMVAGVACSLLCEAVVNAELISLSLIEQLDDNTAHELIYPTDTPIEDY